MATKPNVKTRRVSRDKLAAVFRSHELVTAFEDLNSDVREVLPNAQVASAEAAEAAQAAAEAAQVSANAAGAAATSAASAAAAAQADVDGIKAVPLLVLAGAPVLGQERTLVVDANALTLTDAGPDSTATLASADLIAILPGDVSESAGTFANATGLALALLANATYVIDGLLTVQSAAITTGLALGFTIPAGASISGMYSHNTTATAAQGSYNIASGAVKGNTTDVLAATENVPVSGRWIVKTAGTAGSAQLQLRTEVAASAVTLKAGLSALIARRIA